MLAPGDTGDRTSSKGPVARRKVVAGDGGRDVDGQDKQAIVVLVAGVASPGTSTPCKC